MNGSLVVDVTSESFEKEVIERSHQALVLVDFWASWCGPCQMLTPTLEAVIESMGGAVVLAKINTEEEQELAGLFQIRGIPAVKAFKDGKQISEFTGALPRHQIEAFIRGLMPSQADVYTEKGRALLQEGNRTEARLWLERALEEDSRNPEALLLMGTVFYKNSQFDEAEKFLKRITGGGGVGRASEALLAKIDLARAVEGLDPLNVLQAIVSANPDDLQARLNLGVCFLHDGDMELGFEELLRAASAGLQAEEARHRMVQGFAMLGPDHAMTRNYRGRLASLLY